LYVESNNVNALRGNSIVYLKLGDYEKAVPLNKQAALNEIILLLKIPLKSIMDKKCIWMVL
jgi:hypothetical protein